VAHARGARPALSAPATTAHPPHETWRKVGVKEGHRVMLLGAPKTWTNGALPQGATVVRRRGGAPADVVVAFFPSLGALERVAAGLGELVTPDGAVWIAWPRRAAGHDSDLGDAVVRSTMLAGGLVDVKVAALDEDWSGLKFVWRRALRAARRQAL